MKRMMGSKVTVNAAKLAFFTLMIFNRQAVFAASTGSNAADRSETSSAFTVVYILGLFLTAVIVFEYYKRKKEKAKKVRRK